MLAAARALNMNAKLLCTWQKAAQQPLPTDPALSAEVRALPGQQTGDAGAGHVKKTIATCQMLEAHFRIPRPHEPAAFHGPATGSSPHPAAVPGAGRGAPLRSGALVQEMVRADLKLFHRDAYLQVGGHTIPNAYE